VSDETTISETKVVARRRWWESLALIASWIWTIIAGGGGLPRLFEKGPLPLTNGWFAPMSGISACPLTSWLLKKYPGILFSGWMQSGAALAFLIAGRLALAYGHWPIH
jgi:hypothetical protein